MGIVNHDHNAHEVAVGALGCNGRPTQSVSQPATSRAGDCFCQSLPISIECVEKDTRHKVDLETGREPDAVRATRTSGADFGGTVRAPGTGWHTDECPASVFLPAFQRCHPVYRAIPRAENGDVGSIAQGAGSNSVTGRTVRREGANDGDEHQETILGLCPVQHGREAWEMRTGLRLYGACATTFDAPCRQRPRPLIDISWGDRWSRARWLENGGANPHVTENVGAMGRNGGTFRSLASSTSDMATSLEGWQ